MDKLSIFGGTSEVSIKSKAGHTIDTVVDGLGDIERELLLTRKGNEVAVYGEEVEEMEDVELEEVNNGES